MRVLTRRLHVLKVVKRRWACILVGEHRPLARRLSRRFRVGAALARDDDVEARGRHTLAQKNHPLCTHTRDSGCGLSDARMVCWNEGCHVMLRACAMVKGTGCCVLIRARVRACLMDPPIPHHTAQVQVHVRREVGEVGQVRGARAEGMQVRGRALAGRPCACSVVTGVVGDDVDGPLVEVPKGFAIELEHLRGVHHAGGKVTRGQVTRGR